MSSGPVETRQNLRKLARSYVPVQFAWYVLVGGLSFLADLAVFAGLLRLDLPLMTSLVAGFAIGTLVNYALSLSLAFTGGRHRRLMEILRLFAVSVVGLGLTAALVWCFMALGLSALASKVVATPVVLAWNYLGRRLFVFRADMPIGIWRVSAQVLAAARATIPRSGPSESAKFKIAPSAMRNERIEMLGLRERYRDEYRANRDPIADERLLWRAQSFRHLVHLTPGQSILEFGSGDLRFTRKLIEVSRGENPITAATFQPGMALEPSIKGPVERVKLDDLPGALAGRQFDCLVGLDSLDARDCAAVLGDIHDLLAPGGQVVFFESNPWNPWLKFKRLFAERDPRRLLSRPRLYELLSEVGFIRVFAVYTDFVYAPLTPRLIWLLRNLSIIAENTPFVGRLAGTLLLHAQKPPRTQLRPRRPLSDYESLRDAVSVVIPCHNEEMNIGPLIDQLFELFDDYIHEIVPVDDNSRDSTAAVIAHYAAANPRVRPVYRKPPNGVGRAIADGYRAANGRWVLSMDCDFQHLLPEVRDLFDHAANGSPVVVGSRFSRHSVLLNYPFAKIVSNRAFHVLAQLIMRRRFRDITNNLKLLRRDVVDRLDLTAPGFAVNAETGLQPMLMGYQIAEAPISWINRTYDMGSSSFHLVRVGGGYASVLWAAFLARTFGVGRYRTLLGTSARLTAADESTISKTEA
jgi:dolichol-phosphate mannosyltransferase